MNLTTRQLQAFVRTAQLKSFTRAAEKLHITQAGLSAMIQEMEGQLGARLFDRTTRSVSITVAGQRLLPVAERMIEELGEAARDISRSTSIARRTLTVAATPIVSAFLVPQACGQLKKLRPDLQVRVKDVSRQEVQDCVESGECDVGVGAFLQPTAGIDRMRIFDFPLLLITQGPTPFTKKHWQQAAQSAVPWRELLDEPLLGMRVDHPIQMLIDGHLRRIGRADEDRPSFNTFQTLLHMVEAGFGSAVLPSFNFAAVQGLRLRVSYLSEPRVDASFFRIVKKGRAPAEAVDDFTRCLVDVLQRCCVP